MKAPDLTMAELNVVARRQYPVDVERLAWAQLQVAFLVHDGAHTVRTWQARQSAYSTWAAAFLHDDGTTA